ncbi:ubiquinol-cytochrome-c reductase complex subunit-domain-containing protein [Xylogone sp. PMI_703]|nr:ubiquinol-cytochrome-c reductase complex subunit-domain-containing protein [Xylogone sp. PMI_703]
MNAAVRRSTALKASGLQRRFLTTYKSAYGPKYTVPLQVEGWTIKDATRLGITLAGFGSAAGVFALFFFSDIPRVRKDILTKIPVVGSYWVKEVHPADNPF